MKLPLLFAAILAALMPIAAARADDFLPNEPGPFQIPAGTPGVTQGPASVYPITFTVSGLGSVTDVNLSLNGLTHSFVDDLDVVLVAPDGTRVMLLSDAGGGSVSGVTFVFDQQAPLPMGDTGNGGSGSYQPSNYEGGQGDTDAFPAPAPAGPYAASLDAFNGTNPNGVWSLFINDDANADVGSLAGATLSITAAPEPATWAMMIGGFGFVGAALRRRRRITDSLPSGVLPAAG